MYEEITKKKIPNQPTTHNYFKLKQLKSKTTTTIGPRTLFRLEQKKEALCWPNSTEVNVLPAKYLAPSFPTAIIKQ